MSDDAVLTATELCKSFQQGGERIEVLQNTNLIVRPGERVAIVGRSGSGKSTLLHVLAGLDDVDSGTVTIMNEDMTAADNNRRAEIRRLNMGFVYQAHHLLPEFSAVENVAMPLRLAGVKRRKANEHALEILTQVGLANRATHAPHALSGGERQRVAVARALVHRPRIVLADEPTGNLDQHNAEQIMALLVTLSRAQGTAFVVVTHDVDMLTRFDRVLQLEAGQLRADQADGSWS